MGDPAGIGPDILNDHLQNYDHGDACVVVFGDRNLLLSIPKSNFIEPEELKRQLGQRALGAGVYLCPLSEFATRPWVEQLTDEHRKATLSYIETATDFCISQRLDGMVTGPVSKAQIAAVSPGFRGHTEYVATRAKCEQPVMMMHSPDLKVMLATTHIPLAHVPQTVNAATLETIIRISHRSLQRLFGLNRPRIGVAALNPHGGEGLFGDEDQRLVEPAIAACQTKEIEASGPHSADTLFWRARRGEFDAVLALYHDQGLIAAKTLDFEHTVNVTLGLPFIRTSVDHGTAYDLAKRAGASSRNLTAAVDLALRIYQNRSS